jgi:hypothetical protein
VSDAWFVVQAIVADVAVMLEADTAEIAGPLFVTVTATPEDVVVLPAASRAVAVME